VAQVGCPVSLVRARRTAPLFSVQKVPPAGWGSLRGGRKVQLRKALPGVRQFTAPANPARVRPAHLLDGLACNRLLTSSASRVPLRSTRPFGVATRHLQPAPGQDFHPLEPRAIIAHATVQRAKLTESWAATHNPKAEVAAAVAGSVPVAACGSAVPGMEVPGPTAQHTVGTFRQSLRVNRRLGLVGRVPVRAPLVDIPGHVADAPRVRHLQPHWMRRALAVLAVPPGPVEVGFHIACVVGGPGSRPAGVLPFRLRRQSNGQPRLLARLLAELLSLVPRHLLHG